MSGTISFLPGLLSGLFPTSSNTGAASLLSVLYGSGSQTTNALGQNPITALQQAEQNETQDVKATAAQPAVQRDVQAFVKAVQTATTPQQLLDNPSAMKVLLTANGLADQLPYTALAQKALLSDVNDPNSLANTLTDNRWKSVAQTYSFATSGLSVIQDPKVISTITNAYAEISWRHSLDATTPGLSNALTFRANAGTVTSVDQILGDPVLRSVVTTTLGIPLQIAFQPLEAQEKAITSRLDISQLQDPKFVETFAQKYLIAAAAAPTTAATKPGIEALAIQAQSLVV
ncbi:MAG TPA: DUF1217 domain-containing protein [Acetobacteraceae bacterium]|nr:DUF1217 domain-containing protein [Acetobacteraceae bacterium]